MAVLRSIRRSPEPSLSTVVAVTPALAPLILPAASDRVSVALMSMSTVCGLRQQRFWGRLSGCHLKLGSCPYRAPGRCQGRRGGLRLGQVLHLHAGTRWLPAAHGGNRHRLGIRRASGDAFQPVTLVSLLLSPYPSADTSDLKLPKAEILCW